MLKARRHLFGSWYVIKHPINVLYLIVFGVLSSHGLSLLVSMANIDNILGSYESAMETLTAEWNLFTWIWICILTPVVEEFIFRGIIYNLLKCLTKKITDSPIFAMTAASLVFGAAHLNLAQGVYAFLYGFILCAIYDTYKNIIAPVTVHAAANLFALILEYTGFDYPNIFTAAAVMVLLIALSAVLYFALIRPAAPRASEDFNQAVY